MSRGSGALALALLLSGGCTLPELIHELEEEPSEDALSYPSGPTAIRMGETLPDLSFEGISAEGERTTLRLAHFYRPSEPEPRVLVIQVSGGLWCGTCLWTASHFDEVLGPELSEQVERLELIVRDRDNAPASADVDAEAWRDAIGAARLPVGVDPAFVMGEALEGVAAPLPLVLVVDARTMTLVDVASDPTPGELRRSVSGVVAALAGRDAPEPPPEPLVDGLFDRREWDLFLEMAQVPGAPPADPTNEVADSPAAQRLGEALFFDEELSPAGEIFCATCHDPAKALSDDRPRAMGTGEGSRRTPSIALAAHARWQNWDGRADTLWAQALGPLESPLEQASSRTFVARRVLDRHEELYRAAFPAAPLPRTDAWPRQGKPGDPAYDALPAGVRHDITAIFVHVGKALAAYERTFRVQPTRFDAYVNGDPGALTSDEKLGMKAFATSGCLQCHFGPRLTNDAFHNTGARTGGADGRPDAGRLEGFEAWLSSEVRADGPWSAAPDVSRSRARSEVMLGQFKTPSLRGVAELSAFNHGGGASSLTAVTEAYGAGGSSAQDPSSTGAREPWLQEFGETAQWALVPFLRTLTAEVVVR